MTGLDGAIKARAEQHGEGWLIQQGQQAGMVFHLQAQIFHPCPLAKLLEVGGPGQGIRVAVPGQHHLGTIHHVAKFGALGLEVGGVVLTGIHHQGHPPLNLESIAAQSGNFAGIVGDQLQPLHAEIAQDLGANSVVAEVRCKAQPFVGLHGVQARVLQGIGLELVDQADATPFLAQIHHHPLSRRFHHAECRFQLGPAITAERTEGIAREALGVHPNQDRTCRCFGMAFDDRHVLAAIELIAVADGSKRAKSTG